MGKHITPKQFLALPLSQAILQVIDDVKAVKRLGIDIYMDSWWVSGRENKEPCSVCLGGAALCSWAPEKVDGLSIEKFGREVLGLSNKETWMIANTFNNIRLGHICSAFNCWKGNCPHVDIPDSVQEIQDWAYDQMPEWEFSGREHQFDLKTLLSYLRKLSNKLAKAGY